jgi:hypothetical protein
MGKWCITCLLILFFQLNAQVAVSPTFIARSQSRYKIHQLVGNRWNGVQDNVIVEIDDQEAPDENEPLCKTQENSKEKWSGLLSFLVGYNQSFQSDMIAKCLFGNDICNGRIKVQGSEVPNRDPKAWLADYFYLSPEFNGIFSFKPTIQNVLIDIGFYLKMDNIASGLYLRAYTPLTWTKWNKRFCESIQRKGSSGYQEGCFGSDSVPKSALNSSIQDYMSGAAPSINGITAYDLRFAKINNCDESHVGLADIRMELGWNFIENNDYHIGINIQTAFPTGNRHNAQNVFQPIIGNGRHWELGGGLTTHYTFYRNEELNREMYLYLDLNLTHLFRTYEQRTFDIVDRPNSRYMLAQKITSPALNNLGAAKTSAATVLSSDPISSQFDNTYSPVANLTTAQLKISSAVQVDFIAMFNFCLDTIKSLGTGPHNLNFSFGYNLWARSCDKISNSRKCASSLSIFHENNDNIWALKGDAQMFGYATTTAGGLTQNEAIPLSATQSGASIHQGTNSSASGTNQTQRNLGVDTAEFAYAGTNDQRLTYAPSLANVEANHIKTSAAPEPINFSNINLQATRGLSHTVFAHLSKTFKQKKITPFFGIGGAVEIGIHKTNTVLFHPSETSFIDSCNDRCISCSFSQWHIWLKGGFDF